ncbi:hypothetical protein, partial [Aeromonas caviae]|uniref:hypothetical protein n=1 Tax=Aeromonas caviae TaxID=648 RepID=UPI004039DFEA
RRSWYYRSVKAAPKLQEHLVTPIKNMIEENPSFGYRTLANLPALELEDALYRVLVEPQQGCNRPVTERWVL